MSQTYTDLFVYGKKQILLLLSTLLLLALVYALERTGILQGRLRAAAIGRKSSSMTNLYIVGFCTSAFVFIVFAFSRLVTHAFNTRYCLVTALGFVILGCLVVDRLPSLQIAILLSYYLPLALVY